MHCGIVAKRIAFAHIVKLFKIFIVSQRIMPLIGYTYAIVNVQTARVAATLDTEMD